MKFITSDHVRLDYEDEGTGYPVILVSGLGMCKEIWRPTKEFLLQNGYRVVTFDARNQGASEHTFKGARISRHAIDVYELLQSLSSEHCLSSTSIFDVAPLAIALTSTFAVPLEEIENEGCKMAAFSLCKIGPISNAGSLISAAFAFACIFTANNALIPSKHTILFVSLLIFVIIKNPPYISLY